MHRREGKLILAATDLVGFLECGHLTNLERQADAGLIHKPTQREDPEVLLLQRRGHAHEARYIEFLETQGRTITHGDEDWEHSYEDRAATTDRLMREGAEVIYQATVFHGQWVGFPDFLLRKGEPGELGKDHHYEVADTKLAHTAKASALIQICSYVEQIERLQGVRPEKVYVVTGGAEIKEHPFRTAEMMAYYRHAKGRFEAALATQLDARSTYPDPVGHCDVCRWRPVCDHQWRQDDALKLIAGISRKQRTELVGLGIATRAGVATADLKGYEKVEAQARLQVASDGLPQPKYELLRPERDSADGLVADRGLSALPKPSVGDLFFDIEGDPFAFWEGLEYLFGIWGDGDYQGIWAMNRDEEKVAFEQVMDLFMSRWKQYPEMHIYHYAPYEPTHLKMLAGRHATREEELDQLLRGRVFVDLYRVVRQGVRVGAESYSIKKLEPLYGYAREIALRDANSSIVEFESVLEEGDPSGEVRAQIQLYNRDDCISTERLRDWLEERRVDAALEFGVELPRLPLGPEAKPVQLLSEQAQRTADLIARLTADEPTKLLANLLDWHRREDKSTWWHYYDLIEKSDDELLDEKAAIAHLELIDHYEPGGKSRSYVWRYRFPAQELGIDLGYADDPQLGPHKSTGEIVSLDEKAGIVEIRRVKEWAGPHPRSVVQVNVIDAKEQKKALLRLGEWVADKGIEAEGTEWQAARDLLMCQPPKVAGQVRGETLSREGESGSVAALRIVGQLDGTTLAIQGPPGSGKTYTGARMILGLVRAGKKVGITSNSHKVIGNLIEAVVEAARDENVAVRIVQKAKEHEAVRHGAVRRVDDNSEVADALREDTADIAAGTPWLWAREEMAGSVETLFVDEAGQVSLANVIALSGAARNVVLLGDPQQLDQPTQGVHPDGAGVSALTHLLDGAKTVSTDKGLFLERTYRMHPRITEFTSELFYEAKLRAVDGLDRQAVLGSDWLAGSGLRWVPVEHEGNTNASEEEARKVVEIVATLAGRGWINAKGEQHPVTQGDLRVVSPFNAHRLLIDDLLRRAGMPDVQVGTVDKFQGQQAPVSIYSMATSRPEDAPRGLDFLYSPNRLNVATSRAKALAIVIASPRLLEALAHSPDQLRMVNGLCAFVEEAG